MRLFMHGLLLASGLAISVVAQTSANIREVDLAKLREIHAIHEGAVNGGDLTRMRPHLAADFTGVMFTAELVRGQVEWENHWKRIRELFGTGGAYQTKFNLDRTDFEGNTAVARGSTTDVLKTVRGREFKFACQWTAVFVRQQDQWKLVRWHATMDPIVNAFVSQQVSTMRFAFGMGGIVMAVIVGLAAWNIARSLPPKPVD